MVLTGGFEPLYSRLCPLCMVVKRICKMNVESSEYMFTFKVECTIGETGTAALATLLLVRSGVVHLR